MKIISFEYYDKARQWQLKPISFGNLTLLVGVSGVGKTQILRSILNVLDLAKGKQLNGVKWAITFQLSSGEIYEWQGEFENQGYDKETFFNFNLITDEDPDEKDAPKLLSESLTCNGQTIARRDSIDIYFKDAKTVKLPQTKSIIHLLKEEDPIALVEKNLRLVILNDYANTRLGIEFYTDIDEHTSLDDIRNSNESSRTKFYLCSKLAPQLFAVIKQSFIDVFPFVSDLRIEPISLSKLPPRFLRLLFPVEYPIIQIKEFGVDNWINEDKISSGMYRTLLQISDLYLCADGTVFLIDEFENSLGVNCIDDVTNVLISHQRDAQFIITSHHPYIINNINHKNWKVITRHGGIVNAYDATEFDFNKSKHEAFTQLINRDEYLNGVQV